MADTIRKIPKENEISPEMDEIPPDTDLQRQYKEENYMQNEYNINRGYQNIKEGQQYQIMQNNIINPISPKYKEYQLTHYDQQYQSPSFNREYETIQQNQGYFNARLISAKIIGNNSINLNQGSKRQLYKLIEAVPVRFYDVQGTQFINQSNNSQINLQQYNNDTYIVQKATKESNYQINTQSSGNQCTCACGTKNEKKCCCPLGCPEMNEEYEIVSKEYFEQCMKMKKK